MSPGMPICAVAAPRSSTAAPGRRFRPPPPFPPPRAGEGEGGGGGMLGRGLAVAALAAALDQASKAAVLGFFGEAGCANHRLPLTAFLDLVLTCNSGVSFGMFNRTGLNSLIFSVLAALVVVVLVFWLARVRSNLLAAAIGLA